LPAMPENISATRLQPNKQNIQIIFHIPFPLVSRKFFSRHTACFYLISRERERERERDRGRAIINQSANRRQDSDTSHARTFFTQAWQQRTYLDGHYITLV
jgi:hypothetical protein